MSTSALQGALECAALGRRIVPLWGLVPTGNGLVCRCPKHSDCSHPGKHPIEIGWKTQATTERVTIRRWAVGLDSKGKPNHALQDCNFGMVVGEDVAALDIDPRNGGTLDDLPATAWVVETGGGGQHRLYQKDPTTKMPGRLREGIDIKTGPGAFLVCPGSLHQSGRIYLWTARPASLSELPQIPVGLMSLNGQTGPGRGRSQLADLLRHPPAEGSRNDWLTRVAGHHAKAFRGKEDAYRALVSQANATLASPLDDAEVTKTADSVWREEQQKREAGGGERSTHAERLLAISRDLELFHSPEGEAFFSTLVEGHRETGRVRSRGKEHLLRRFFNSEGRPPPSHALEDTLKLLESRARLDGPECPVAVRVAGGSGGAIYLDLGDPDWRVVVVTSDGWRVATDPPVRFHRPPGVRALPTPERGGSLEELRKRLNLDDEGWALVAPWLVMAVRPTGPYPILALIGEQGSTKSTMARALRSLIDPNAAPLRSEPRDERDLAIAASNSWIVAWDNVSTLSKGTSDALCRLASGGGLSTRALYTDADEKLFDLCRPVMLNGIDEFPSRGDLLDRSLLVYLQTVSEEERRPETDFWADLERVGPLLLGALLDAVSVAIRRMPEVRAETKRLPRMADFALWGMAAEPALGLSPGTFLEAYAGSRATAVDLAVRADSVAPLIEEFVRQLGLQSSWEGTPTELLAALRKAVPDAVLPKSPTALGMALRRAAPNLRARGIPVRFQRQSTGARRIDLGVTHA